MKLKRFEGPDRDIHEMNEMINKMAANANASQGANVTESFNVIQKEMLNVSLDTYSKYDLNKKLPVNYLDDKDARKLSIAIQVKQFTNTFRVPNYSPVKFDRLSKGMSTVTPRPPPSQLADVESTPKRNRTKEPIIKKTFKLLNMQNEIKMMTPKAQALKLDFSHMDKRQTIEQYRSLRTALFQNINHHTQTS
jgi:hypothetical protein